MTLFNFLTELPLSWYYNFIYFQIILFVPNEDDLILRETIRDLPRKSQQPVDGWRHNFDHFWLTRSEAKSLIPNELKVDASQEVDPEILRRFTQFHLVDHVRGEARPWKPEDIIERQITSTVVEVSDDRVEINLHGVAKINQKPTHRLNPYTRRRVTKDRGVELKIFGSGIYDRKSESFLKLDIVAVGDRWGTDVYNFRDNDLDSAPIGFAFKMIENQPRNRTQPKFSTWGNYESDNE